MKILILGLVLLATAAPQQPPSLVGKWQLMKQTSCIESEIEKDETEETLEGEMYSRSGRTPQVIQFKDNNNAEESTKIVNRRKSYNSKALLYRFDGETLHFLDKRSRTIVESFSVEKISSDSLIISNSARACDTKIFLKIK
jgi:hypothetical protein